MMATVYALAPLVGARTGDFAPAVGRALAVSGPGLTTATGLGILLAMALVWGIIFYSVTPHIRGLPALPLAGVAYGLAAWAVGNWALLPLLGLPAWAATETAVLPVVAHAAFGVILGWLGARAGVAEPDAEER
ncbi:MAG: hypothetical protein IRY95_07495 [Clostridia bacterium]|nr:hypothetical protein [Clostridia bacterium]